MENPSRLALLKHFKWEKVALIVQNLDIYVLVRSLNSDKDKGHSPVSFKYDCIMRARLLRNIVLVKETSCDGCKPTFISFIKGGRLLFSHGPRANKSAKPRFRTRTIFIWHVLTRLARPACAKTKE